MSLHQSIRYINKTIERLYGIVGGIQIDGTLNDVEIERTKEWLESHKKLLNIEPFKGLHDLLSRCLEDGAIDEQEREEILEWCGMFINENPFPYGVTDAIRRLHGILSGIHIDGVITDGEVEELQDYLRAYGSYRENVFPFNELIPLLDRILDDGSISDAEREDISEFCKNFTERVVKDPVLYDDIYVESWMKTASPVFEPLLSICDFNHKIHFVGSSFCFTGPARYGKRSELCKLVEKCGGQPVDKIVHRLDYLVIGAQASPHWSYSTYGRKIEDAIRCNQIGIAQTIFLHEDEFVTQAKKYIEDSGIIDIQKVNDLGWRLCFSGFDKERTQELIHIAKKNGCFVLDAEDKRPYKELDMLVYPNEKYDEMENPEWNVYSEKGFFEQLNYLNSGLKVCFSGFDRSRADELTRIAYDNGFLVRKNVVDGLSFLCCGENPSKNSIKSAKKKGVAIVSEAEFLEVLNGNCAHELPEDNIAYDDEEEECDPPF